MAEAGDLYEFEASLVIASSRPARAAQREPVSKKKTKQKPIDKEQKNKT